MLFFLFLPCPQLSPQYLPHRAFGQLVDECDLPGHLISGQPRAAKGDKLLLAQRCARLGYDKDLDRFTAVGIGHADDGGLRTRDENIGQSAENA